MPLPGKGKFRGGKAGRERTTHEIMNADIVRIEYKQLRHETSIKFLKQPPYVVLQNLYSLTPVRM